jgi:hypothetical protein
MATLKDLAAAMRNLDAQANVFASEIASTAVIIGLTDLVNVTPVDTGAALSNWRVTLNTAVQEIIPPYAPSQRGKMVAGTWTHTIDPAVTREANIPPTLEAARTVLIEKKPGDVIHLQNWMPYIVKLNNGSSKQAPAGFVERAELLIEDFVSKAGK